MIVRNVLIIYFIIGFGLSVNSQTIINPVIHSKSHPSLSVDSVIMNRESTRFYLSVENLNTEGNAWFCADQNISLTESGSGKTHKLQESIGIPICPETYKFKNTGELLSFELIFPSLKNNSKEVDLIENCADNCFSLIGISLDNQLNAEIRLFENAVKLYVGERIKEALPNFEKIGAESLYPDENHFAYTFYIIPVIYEKLKDYEKAKAAYYKLEQSNVLEKQYFLSKLEELPFFKSLAEED